MRTPQYKASVFQVVTADYPIEIAALFILALPVLYFFALIDPNETRRLQPGEEILFFKFAFVIIATGAVRALWKLRTVKLVFDQGIETIGTVTDLSGYKFTSITFAYTYHGREYETVNRVVLTSRTKPLKIGGQVVVVVRTTKPQQALIRNLYIGENDFYKDLPEYERLSAAVSPVQTLVES